MGRTKLTRYFERVARLRTLESININIFLVEDKDLDMVSQEVGAKDYATIIDQTLSLGTAVGQQYAFEKRFFIGVDWLKLNVPLWRLGDPRVERHGNITDEELENKKAELKSQKPRQEPSLCRVYIGMSF